MPSSLSTLNALIPLRAYFFQSSRGRVVFPISVLPERWLGISPDAKEFYGSRRLGDIGVHTASARLAGVAPLSAGLTVNLYQ
jgi:hypothetical protein